MHTPMKTEAEELRELMHDAESLHERFMEAAAALRARMLKARQLPGVAPGTGQAALLRLNKIDQRSMQSSSDLIRVHGELRGIGAEYMGIDHGECPEPSGALAAATFDVTEHA